MSVEKKIIASDHEELLHVYLSDLLKENIPDKKVTLKANECIAESSYRSGHLEYDKYFVIVPFVVAGIKFAIPSRSVSEVVDWSYSSFDQMQDEKLVNNFIKDEIKYSIVKPSALLVPKTHPMRSALINNSYSKLILLKNNYFALACEEVGSPIAVNNDSVKWAGEKSSRLWLAGTLNDLRCALINVDALLFEAQNDSKNKL